MNVFEKRRLDSDDLTYYVGGDGPPLLLVHGLAGAAGNWVDLAPRLASRHRVLIPDLPGHGASGDGPPSATLTTFASAVRRCAEAERLDRPVVVGHSFGGQIALQIAISEPGWLRGLVLAAASGISSSEVKRRYALEVARRLRPARRIEPLRPLILRHLALRKLAFSGWVSDAATLSDGVASEFLAGSAAASTGPALRALLAQDLRTQLHRVRAPGLVLWGARDMALPVADGIEYARRLGAPLRTLADTGHLLIGERPRECAMLIDEFIRALPPRDPA